MAGGAYSERFLIHSGSGYSGYYTVPTGKRIVIKYLMARNDDSVAAASLMEVLGFNIWTGSVPGGTTLMSPETMLVLYDGERMRLWNATQYMRCVVCGYLLQS